MVSIRYGLPLLAVVALLFSVLSVIEERPARIELAPPIAPAESPFEARIAGVGMVEPQSEAVAIATELGGVVKRTYVIDGDRVKTGDPLFALDDRDYRAALDDAEAQIAAESAALNTVERQIEAQDAVIAGQSANLEAAEAQHQLTRATRQRDAILASNQLISRQTFDTAVIDDLKGQAGVSAAAAALSGARRQREVLIAQRTEQRARLAAARSGRQRSAIAIDRCVVRAPIDATVLKVNIHPGEYAQPGVLAAPLMTLGALDQLHLRVEVDETDAWRVEAGAPAVAMIRGNPLLRTPLKFIRFEPVVVPKHTLTGVDDRVDTRVLEAIYAIGSRHFPVHVGQEMDVFIAAPPSPTTQTSNQN